MEVLQGVSTHLNKIFDFKRQLSACVQNLQVLS